MDDLTRRQIQRALAAQRALSRRQFLRRSGLVVGGAVLAPSILAACGDDEETSTGGGGGATDEGAGATDVEYGSLGDGCPDLTAGDGADALKFVNWPLYIDEESAALFAEETGIAFEYLEDYNDNLEYFTATLEPALGQCRAIDADIIAPTFWLTARLIQLGWVEALPLDQVPNAANLRSDLVNPSWDPTGEYSLPWQSGMTGIAYNLEAAGRELGSVEDLFDPEFAGRIGMLTEMRDTVGLLMLNTGADPANPSFDAAQEAFDKLEQAVQDGQIRSFTGNDYQDDLVAGNFVACVGWSGDVAQLTIENPNLRFVIPEEGGMQWSDTMVVPKGAANVPAAARWMDWVYDPVNAARIAAYVQYISPVDGVQEELRNMGGENAALADNPLMFPDEETSARLTSFGALSVEEEQRFDERFTEITG